MLDYTFHLIQKQIAEQLTTAKETQMLERPEDEAEKYLLSLSMGDVVKFRLLSEQHCFTFDYEKWSEYRGTTAYDVKYTVLCSNQMILIDIVYGQSEVYAVLLDGNTQQTVLMSAHNLFDCQ